MAQLVPTPIIDRNGKHTTVHRRAGKPQGPGAHALAGLRPPVAVQRAENDSMAAVKVSGFSEDSRALRIAAEVGVRLGRSEASHDMDEISTTLDLSGKRTVEIAEDVAFDFLRLGVPIDEAALLTELGVTPEAASGATAADWHRGTFAAAMEKNYTIMRKEVRGAVDRLQEAGVPAAKASKALENGLQDEHFGQALDTGELVELFSRWKFKSVAKLYKHGVVRQDDVLMGFLKGTIAFRFSTAPMAALKEIEYDVRTMTTPSDPMYEAFTDDRELVDAVIGKLAGSPQFIADHGYSPVTSLYNLIGEQGRGVLDLDRPVLARGRSMEQARFIEEVFAQAEADDPLTTGWGYHDRGAAIRSFATGNGDVRLLDLQRLHDAGMTAEQAYDSLVVRGLGAEQAIAAARDGIVSSLVDGVL